MMHQLQGPAKENVIERKGKKNTSKKYFSGGLLNTGCLVRLWIALKIFTTHLSNASNNLIYKVPLL